VAVRGAARRSKITPGAALAPRQSITKKVSTAEATMTGTIRTLRVDKGFGFIKDDKGKEYFFHQSAVYGESIDNLREGDSVEFEVGEGPKGPRAENVRRTST
jgi:cold shock protein